MFLKINKTDDIAENICSLLFNKQKCFSYKLQSKDFGLFDHYKASETHICNYTTLNINSHLALISGAMMGFMIYESFLKNDYLSNIVKR